MNDQEIGHVMRRLPRTNASPRFTSEVLRRLAPERTVGHTRLAWRLAATFAMVLTLVVLSFETVAVHQRHQRLEALRSEHRSIENELQQVKAIAEDPRPVVVLENDDTRVIVPVADRRSITAQPIMY